LPQDTKASLFLFFTSDAQILQLFFDIEFDF